MSEANEQMENEIRLTMEEAKRKADLGKSLTILENNEHFKKIFLDYYAGSNIIRLVKAKALTTMQTQEKQFQIMQTLDAIGEFCEFMRYIHIEANMAQKSLNECDEALSEMQNEEG